MKSALILVHVVRVLSTLLQALNSNRRLYVPKTKDARGGWIKAKCGDSSCALPTDDIKVIKSKCMRWVWYMARMGEKTDL
jgi:hypothetical protein